MGVFKYKTKINPHDGKPQLILDEQYLSQQLVVPHTHNISDIQNLQQELEKTKIQSGYFAN